MDNKLKYDIGFIIGRFQPFHNEHLKLIEKLRTLCSKIIILIGSPELENTISDPLPYAIREDIIRQSISKLPFNKDYCNEFIIKPINSINAGNSNYWGNHIINTLSLTCNISGKKIVYISGIEDDRDKWFNESSNIDIIKIKRNNVSATDIRNNIQNNNMDINYLKTQVPTIDEQSASIVFNYIKIAGNNENI